MSISSDWPHVVKLMPWTSRVSRDGFWFAVYHIGLVDIHLKSLVQPTVLMVEFPIASLHARFFLRPNDFPFFQNHWNPHFQFVGASPSCTPPGSMLIPAVATPAPWCAALSRPSSTSYFWPWGNVVPSQKGIYFVYTHSTPERIENWCLGHKIQGA